MKPETMHFTMLNSKIFRNSQTYLDRVLKKYELSSGSYPYLFILDKNEGISQNKISKEIGNDKAMSTRTITKLMELGYIHKIEDEKDNRAYRLFLTDKAKETLPKVHADIQEMIDLITMDLTEDEKLITISSLRKIFNRTQRLKEAAYSEEN